MVTITLEPKKDGNLLIGLQPLDNVAETYLMMNVSDSLTVIDPITQTRITLKYTKCESPPLPKSVHAWKLE